MYVGLDFDLKEIENLFPQPYSENEELVGHEIEHSVIQPHLDYEKTHSDERDGTDSEEESEDDSEANDVFKHYRDQMDILCQALEAAIAQNHVSISKKSTTVFCSPVIFVNLFSNLLYGKFYFTDCSV